MTQLDTHFANAQESATNYSQQFDYVDEDFTETLSSVFDKVEHNKLERALNREQR